MRKYHDLWKEARRGVIAAAWFSGGSAFVLLAGAFLVLAALDDALPNYDFEALTLLGVMALAGVTALFLLDLARGEILLRVATWLDHVWGQFMFEAALKGSAANADIAANAAALDRLRDYLTGAGLRALFDAIWIPLFLLGAFWIHPFVCFVLCAMTTVSILMMLRQGHANNALAMAQDDAMERRRAHERELTAHAALARSQSIATAAAGKWEIINRGFVGRFYQLHRQSYRAASLGRMMFFVTEGAVLASAAWFVMQGEMSLGALVVMLLLAARVMAPLRRLWEEGIQFGQAIAAYRRLKGLADSDLVPQAKAEVAPGDDDGPAYLLEIKNAAVTYEGRVTPALRDISFHVEAGQCLVVSGPAGTGKTTLCALAAGAVAPSVGRVLIEGDRIEDCLLRDEARKIGFLPDQPILFEGTVQQNIQGFNDGGLMSAAQTAMRVGAHELLKDLPDGYETRVGRNGAALSLRERRAVALARAVHGVPALIILDAPENGLDEREVRKLARHLDDMRRDGTTLIIASNDATMQSLADSALLLRDGSIESVGNADDLLKLYAHPENRFEPWRDPSATLSSFTREYK